MNMVGYLIGDRYKIKKGLIRSKIKNTKLWKVERDRNNKKKKLTVALLTGYNLCPKNSSRDKLIKCKI
jgi:hypothetical protein